MNYRNVLNKGTSILKKFSIPSAQIDAELLLSLALKNDKKIWLAALIGSLFSAIQVSRLGNIPVKAKELIESIKKV